MDFDQDATLDLTQQEAFFQQPTDQSPNENAAFSSRYELKDELGKGAMGVVLEAVDKHLHRKVAYKQVLSTMGHKKKQIQRFVSEAQITSQLEHPGVIPIYHMEYQNQWAYSMKLIAGKTLKETLASTRTSLKENDSKNNQEHEQHTLLNLFLKVCDTLDYAHSKQIIHRDLKPSNIMLGDYGEVYLLDWGIAKIYGDQGSADEVDTQGLLWTSDDMEATQDGQILGTPRYMSPEQARGKNKELDHLSDQYALGLILFELVYLKPAFKAKDIVELIKKLLKDEKEPPVSFFPKHKISPVLKAIIHKATALKKEDRYPGVKNMAEDIRRYLRDQESSVLKDNVFQKGLRWARHHTQKTLIFVSVLIALSALGVGGSIYAQSQTILASQKREKAFEFIWSETAMSSQKLDSLFLKYESYLQRLGTQLEIASLNGKPQQKQLSPSHFETHPGYTQKVDPNQVWISPVSLSSSPFLSVQNDLRQFEKLTQNRTEKTLMWISIKVKNQLSMLFPKPENQAENTQAVFQEGFAKNTSLRPHWLAPQTFPASSEKGFMLLLKTPLPHSKLPQTTQSQVGFGVSTAPFKALLLPKLSQAQAVLMDSQGQLIYSSSHSRSTFKIEEQAFLQKNLPQLKSGYQNIEGQVLIYQKLNTMNWYYVLSVPLSELLKEIHP